MIYRGFDAELLVPDISDVPLKERVRRVVNQWCRELGQERDFYLLRRTKCAAVITENGYQDSPASLRFLESDEGKKGHCCAACGGNREVC